jgi:hypothetical protein
VQVTGLPPRVITYDWTDSVRANLDLFAQAAQGRATYSFTPEQLVGNIAILEAIVASAAGGGSILLPKDR